jgi:hypothetical protein
MASAPVCWAGIKHIPALMRNVLSAVKGRWNLLGLGGRKLTQN